MQKKHIFGKTVIAVLGMALLSGVFLEGEASAAGKTSLNYKNITIQAGKSKTLRLKNNKAAVKWSITSGKKYIKLGNKTKKSVKITAIKKGTAKVQAKAGGKKYTCKVTVTAKSTQSKRNAADVAAVKKIIQRQKSLGAYEGLDNLNDTFQYFWDKAGRLTKINWTSADLKGTLSLEGLTALKELYCSDNQIQNLDISKNTALTVLACGDNELAALNVGSQSALKALYCYGNQLTAIDVSKNKELITFSCYKNNISEIDLSNNTKLVTLDCNTNKLKKLDTGSNILLEVLHCQKNQLAGIDVSKNNKIWELACNGNQLLELDVRNNVELEALYCGSNQLKDLDVSNNAKLVLLSCRSNYITQLDLSKNSLIDILEYDHEVEVTK